MRSFPVFLLPLFLLAIPTALASLGAMSDDWNDYTWSYAPDTDYAALGVDPPPAAAPITSVYDGDSYIVKLECLGCPFRVRELEVGDWWEDWDRRANSLVRFTTILGYL